MRHTSDEAALTADAQSVLDEPVLAAGMFGFQNLLGASMAGGTVGALALDHAFGGLGGAIGAGIGGALATKAAAAEQGATVKLVVAVTADHIHVLRWDGGTDPQRIIRTFERATTTVDVRSFGLSRIVTLTDRTTGDAVELHASVSRIARQSGPDKDVLALLTAV